MGLKTQAGRAAEVYLPIPEAPAPWTAETWTDLGAQFEEAASELEQVAARARSAAAGCMAAAEILNGGGRIGGGDD